MPTPAPSISALGDLLRSLGGTVGQLVSCYVRAGTGDPATWTHFLLPFGTPATPLPIGVWFDNPGTGVAVGTAHATARATIDPTGLPSGTTRVAIDLDLQAAPALTEPRLQLVICTERGVLVQSGQPAPERLGVAVIDLRAAATSGLPRALRLTVTLPPNDHVTTRATVAASVTPRAGQTAAPLHVGIVDGVTATRPALLATTVGLSSLPAGLGTTLGGVLGGLLGGAGLTVTTSIGEIHTVDPDGPVTGLRADLTATPAVANTALTWSADLDTSWAPGARPAVTTNHPGGPLRVRYAVAARRADGSETPPGAESAPAAVAAGAGVQVTLPPAPSGMTAFSGWRVYRSRLTGADWSTPVLVDDRAAGTTFTDTVDADDAAFAGTPPPEPAALRLVWHGPTSPDPLTLDAAVRTVDESLDALAPPARPTMAITARVTLPPSVALDLRPGRGTTSATTVHWESGAGSRAGVDVRLERPRTGLDVHVQSAALPRTVDAAVLVDTPVLTTATWTATETCAVTGSAVLPGEAGARTELTDLSAALPSVFSVGLRAVDDPPTATPDVTDVAAGWCASAACGPLVVRVVETPATGSTDPVTLTDARIESLPADLALHLRLPAKHAVDPPLLVDAGGWQGRPAPGDVPAAVPAIGGPGGSLSGLRLVRRPRPATLPALPVRGPGPGLAADLRSAPAGLQLLDVRASGVTRVRIDKAAGRDTNVHATATIEPTGARIQLASVDDDGVPTTVQVRARRIGPALDVRIERREGGLLDVTTGAEADAIEGLRIFQESGGTTDGAARPVAAHRPTASSDVTAVVASLDRLAAGEARVSLHPVGDEPPPGSDEPRPMRISATLDDDADTRPHRLRLSLQARRDGEGPKPVDVDAELPAELQAVVQGDAGTLGPDTGAGTGGDVVLHDPLALFEPGWVGRAVRWSGGTGVVIGVPDATHLDVTPDAGATVPDEHAGRPARNWYRVVDDPRRDTGVRVTPSRPIRARVAAAAIGGWGLCGITSTPQLRVESEPDLVLPASPDEPARGATAGLSVRVAGLARVVQSAWRGTGELPRLHSLLGSSSTFALPPQDDVLAEVPELSWLCADVAFQDRPLRSLLAVLHHPPARPAPADLTGRQRTLGAQVRAEPDGVEQARDALRLRLFDVPDGLHLRIGPGVMELANSDAIRGGRMHAEPSLWMRSPAPFAEAGYGSTFINRFPPTLVLASGVAAPDLGGGVTTSGSMTFGSQTVRSFNTPATRILVAGGDLDLGRQRSVAWDGPRSGSKDPWARDTPTDAGLGSELFWSLSDVWFMRLTPTGSGPGELLLFTPGEPKGDGDPKSAIEAKATGVQVTARILKVKLGAREMVPARRAVLEAGDWPAELAAEIQLDGVEGAFAVGMDGLGITDWMQTDQTTAGHWWMCAYDAILGFEAAQFGSSFGTIDLRDAPWDPYWA